jgi:hypothetical protein
MVKCLCLWTANWERQDVHDDGLECDSLVSEQERQQTTQTSMVNYMAAGDVFKMASECEGILLHEYRGLTH